MSLAGHNHTFQNGYVKYLIQIYVTENDMIRF